MKLNFKLTLLFVLTLISNVFAQDEFYTLLNKTIDVKEEVFFSDKFYDKAFLFSVNVDISSKGVIDTVTFSHYRYHDELGQLIDFIKIRDDLKNKKIRLKEYKNSIAVLMVMVIRGDNAMITVTNGNQLLNNWKHIIQSSAELPRKKLVHLTPRVISSVGRGLIP
jgi:hypothetical protein